MAARILVAEDDVKQADLIRLYLERDGHSVMVVHDGRSALDRIRRHRPDLVVLDLMLPRMDGLDVARVVQREMSVPIIMVTARTAEDDVLLGLDLGADDYITKPFSPRELAARVWAVLRRGVDTDTADVIEIGRVALDRGRHEVRVDGGAVSVTPREFSLLEVLMVSAGRAFSRAQLAEKAFGFDWFGLERTVDAHVMKLRRKIEPYPSSRSLIETVYGVGYRFTDDA